ncbi:small acid-soluble spore protein Tlp [Desertibacillus haloalkaliphilus]|nr:small acid-soluble spore protein Tlp [Desertibacillus haloalkaliphilus]MBU8907435.1 small acid-soluble spore protein Tlp [Desertibacillus haloalkaliphilus]
MTHHDNRKNNVERLQQMRENTIRKIDEAAEQLETAGLTEEEREQLLAKNQRREESIAAFESEIADEQKARENGEI